MSGISPPALSGISQLSVDFMQKAGTGRADGSLVAARLWLSSEREGAWLVVHLAAEPATSNKLPSLTCFGAPGSLSVSLKGLLQGPCAA